MGRYTLKIYNIHGKHIADDSKSLVGKNLRKAALHDRDFCCADFSNSDLREADLRDGDFTGANFTGANLSGADMSGAKFTKAKFVVAYLKSANMRGADFYAANFNGATLNRANMQGAILEMADLSDASLFDTILRDANIRKVNLANAKHNLPIFRLDFCEWDISFNGCDLQIDCQVFTVDEWEAFKVASSFEPKALVFYSKHRNMLLNLTRQLNAGTST